MLELPEWQADQNEDHRLETRSAFCHNFGIYQVKTMVDEADRQQEDKGIWV